MSPPLSFQLSLVLIIFCLLSYMPQTIKNAQQSIEVNTIAFPMYSFPNNNGKMLDFFPFMFFDTYIIPDAFANHKMLHSASGSEIR